ARLLVIPYFNTYEGKEDEIIQLVEFGDVTLPLNGTLITGSQRLFGIKNQLQFGRATISSVFSKQESKSQSITVSGGAQMTDFYIKADEYEENKHFFIAQYFRDNYDKSLENLPIINSPVNITKIEVWVTNRGAATTENRNIVALLDLGEQDVYSDQIFVPGGSAFPDNYASNDVMASLLPPLSPDSIKMRDINQVSTYLKDQKGLTPGTHFEKVENARKLSQHEYTFNSKLGFISLTRRLNSDEVLAVAFQYQVIGKNKVYQVGEFSNEGITGASTLVLKLLRSTNINTEVPTWDLMMKNVYWLGSYQINSEDFRLNVVYSDDKNGVPMGFLTETEIASIPLIQVMNCDNLNTMQEPYSDGVFDFVDNAATGGGTVQSANGRIYFPVVEPFGENLKKQISSAEHQEKYVFEELYRKTKTEARQLPHKNKYYLEGMFKSAGGSEISLGGFNIPQGSVKVSAGGIVLQENVHYTVDYTLGRVRIMDEGILNSGTPITISTESEDVFNIQSKRLMGSHIDYRVNEDFNIGGTILNLHEKPITQKVNYEDEPISNTIIGLDMQFQTEVPFVTKLIDKLPFIDTKAPSRLTFDAEGAYLIPGHPRVIGKTGTSYIDDFEGGSIGIDMKNIGQWHLASTPQGQPTLFPEGELNNDLAYGYNRAKLAWYVVDPLFFDKTQKVSLTNEQKNNHYTRRIREQEVFPNKENENNVEIPLAVLNMVLYPEQRGPYNYETTGSSFSAGLNPDGTLKNPSSRWGGITRKIETSDFEATNIEYIEFWIMDPFIDPDENNSSNGPLEPLKSNGYLYINLGDISEDILKDGRKSWENGLPTGPNVTDVDTTIWGRVPTKNQIVNAFDNDPDSRAYQDVGYDGLRDEDERSFFSNYLQELSTYLDPNVYAGFVDDPSGDNYHYFLGPDLDNANADILQRYENYNGVHGNSNTSKQDDQLGITPTLASTLPDVEDINNDNTLSEGENYFQYKIELSPDKMKVGENFITDVYTAQNVPLNDNKTANVTWYQFKVPISQYEKPVGEIRDFKSIRFMRMFMRGFNETVVLRFATLKLVRGEWRKYAYSLVEPGEYIPNDDQTGTIFDVSTVNIEENAFRKPINYMLPPDIEREKNINSTKLTQLNEQSLALKVCGIIDGDARAVYRTTDFDLRRYRKLKMYVHGESACYDYDQVKSGELKDGDLSVFIRLGTDFSSNYYEYEIPINFTEWGVNSSMATAPLQIWPLENNMEVNLELLTQIKQQRNILMRNGDPDVSLITPFVAYDGGAKITVIGTPSLSEVKTIMIGIRNPKKHGITDMNDDGLPKSAEIWVNELRLTDFNEHGGWAATARASLSLADLGNLMLAGTISTPGFGSIDKKINDRQMETNISYDIVTDLDLGRFFPSKSGVRIPLHFDYSEMIANPEYNPLNPDIKFKDDLETYVDPNDRDSIKQLSQDYTMRKSINLINVGKSKTNREKPSRFYDVSNFNVSYSYNETTKRNIDIEYDVKQKYTGTIAYNYTSSPKNHRPFSNNKFLSKYKALALIKDVNFFLSPKMMSFRTFMNREYQEQKLRNKSQAVIILEPTYIKRFEWNRLYNLKYDLTQAIQFDFNANAGALVREPAGKIDKADPEAYQSYRDTILEQLVNFGDINTYQHQLNLNWNLPINKLPLMDWLSATAQYNGTYNFAAAQLAAADLGNTIDNTRNVRINGSANLTTLYNKIPYLKKLDQEMKKKQQERGGGRFTREIKQLEAEQGPDTVKTKKNYWKIALDNMLRILTGVKNVSVSYNEMTGVMLPGFAHKPTYLGNVWDINAPGLPFVTGFTTESLLTDAFNDGWMVASDDNITTAFMSNYSNNLNLRATLEPLPGLRVEMNAKRTIMSNESAVLRRSDTVPEGYVKYTPQVNGNFSISMITWKTAFSKEGDDNYNENYENFLNSRLNIANRLAGKNPNWNGQYVYDQTTGEYFPDGYGPLSQDVLLPAFIAAYTGMNDNTVALSPFPKIPLPNWTITYTGLTQIDFVKKFFRSFSINHAYRSSYNIGGFVQNVNYQADDDGFQYIKDQLGNNYLPEYEINQLAITEQFSPLIKLDMSMHNSLSLTVEYKSTRNLSLSFANNQLTEVSGNDFVLGAGYRIQEVKFNIRTGGSSKQLESDLLLKLDFSFRSTKTILRKIVEEIDQISQGQKMISINFAADYMVSDQIRLRLFYDQNLSRPFVSNQFPTSNINSGISLTFSLAP
ncbi:MAG: cell surface protein SprA, partial [Bacteroidales bacterium]|nr:cell surface protein SprA [Bacteroidales bacterium]